MDQYRLYIDEYGTDDLVSCSVEAYRYLCVVGVLVKKSDALTKLVPSFNGLRQDINFFDDPDISINFHRADIFQYKGPFQNLRGKIEIFTQQIINIIDTVPFTLIAVTIDKKAMLQLPYWQNKAPYHFAMEVMVEKVAQLLANRLNGNADLMAEKRHGKKDNALQSAYAEIRRTGTRYVAHGLIQERLLGDNIKFRNKFDNIDGLQLADLIAKACFEYIMKKRNPIYQPSPFSARIFPILERKFDRSQAGTLWGYGIKFIP